jgi:hypothetical protein
MSPRAIILLYALLPGLAWAGSYDRFERRETPAYRDTGRAESYRIERTPETRHPSYEYRAYPQDARRAREDSYQRYDNQRNDGLRERRTRSYP